VSRSGTRRYFGGDTVQQALLQAARHYQLDPDEIAFQVLDKRHGFLKSRRKVTIEVDPAAPRRRAAAAGASPAAPAPAAPAPPAQTAREGGANHATPRAHSRPGDTPRRQERARTPVRRPDPEDATRCADAVGLLAGLGLLDVSPTVSVRDDELSVDLAGPDADRLRREPELLAALEQLAGRLVRGLGSEGVLVRIEGAGAPAGRGDALRREALELAAQVVADREPRALAPLPPRERRLVHLALAEDPGVETASEGEGFLKRVIIRPRA
jgi:spoIIIJ-associated protein